MTFHPVAVGAHGGACGPLRSLADVDWLDPAWQRVARARLGELEAVEGRTVAALGAWGDRAMRDLGAIVRWHRGDRLELLRALDGWPDPRLDPVFEGAVFEGSLVADLGGRLMVAGVELGADRVVSLARTPGAVVRLDGPPGSAPFFDQPFDDAVAFFRAKRLVDPSAFDAIHDRHKAGAFVARRLATITLQERVRAVLATEIEAARSIDEMLIALERAAGVSARDNAGRWYIETVARTNLATAYGAGRWAQINDPVVARLRPFVQYRTARDERVRIPHRLLHGKVFRLDSALAAQYAPPLGFNCRCVYVTLSERQVRQRRLRVETTYVMLPGGVPYLGDRGFERPPGRGPVPKTSDPRVEPAPPPPPPPPPPPTHRETVRADLEALSRSLGTSRVRDGRAAREAVRRLLAEEGITGGVGAVGSDRGTLVTRALGSGVEGQAWSPTAKIELAPHVTPQIRADLADLLSPDGPSRTRGLGLHVLVHEELHCATKVRMSGVVRRGPDYLEEVTTEVVARRVMRRLYLDEEDPGDVRKVGGLLGPYLTPYQGVGMAYQAIVARMARQIRTAYRLTPEQAERVLDRAALRWKRRPQPADPRGEALATPEEAITLWGEDVDREVEALTGAPPNPAQSVSFRLAALTWQRKIVSTPDAAWRLPDDTGSGESRF